MRRQSATGLFLLALGTTWMGGADASWALNDSGVDWWTDGFDGFLESEPAGYPGQDASFGRDATDANDADGRAGFAFTKLDASGNPMAPTAGVWSCVRDNVTGLVWEAKQNDGGLHDRDDRFNWRQTDSALNGGSPGFEDEDGAVCFGYNAGVSASYCNTQAFVERVNGAALCGATDWRMPTRGELRSIADYGVPEPAIDNLFFPNTAPGAYWSGTPLAEWESDAWLFYFSDGATGFDFKSAAHHVRLVRAGKTATSGYELTVAVTGGDFGSIVSDPPGIDCGTACSARFDEDQTVTLTATPATGYSLSWGGACAGAEPMCEVTMNADQAVSATFSAAVPPVVTAPADVTIEATAVLTPLTTEDIGTAESPDGTPTNDAPAEGFPLGETIVTWSVTNAAGVTATAQQTVTVQDTTAPLLTVPADISVAATGTTTPVVLGEATASDIFEPLTIANDAPTDGFPLGTTTVTWTATDANANASSATQRVTVTDAPPPSADGPNLFHGSVAGVGANWQTVTLPSSYADPVVVTSVQYDAGALPVVARVRNAAGSSFELRVQNPGDLGAPGGYTVRYVVVEAGVYTEAEDGIKLEAGTLVSTRTDGQINGWVGQARAYANSYAQPVVLGQVMSENDARWSVFWARGADRNTPPSASALYIGKHVGEDSDSTRLDETLGYIVLEAGSGNAGGVGYKAGVSAATIAGVGTKPPYLVAYGLPEADGGVVSSAAMTGGNGGWPILFGAAPFAGGNLDLAIDEDQIKDAERWHGAEPVSYLLFSPDSGGGIGDGEPKLHGGRVDGVGSTPRTVLLPEAYTDAVVVATVQYEAGLAPVVARVSNVGTDGFELRVQNPSGAALPGVYTVHYVVAEAGVYTEAAHGIKLEARKLRSTRTDSKSNGWVAQQAGYVNAYAQPVVIGQVMSENDARWSVFWARGANRSSAPDSANLWVGKHTGEDPDDTRADETLGYIVLEAGSGVLDDGQSYRAGISAQDILGTGSSGAPYPIAHDVAAVGGAVLSAATMRGGDGGWPVLYGDSPLDGTRIDVAVEEDRVQDSESFHTEERAGFVVFGDGDGDGDGGGIDPGTGTGPSLAYAVVSAVGSDWQSLGAVTDSYTAPVIVASVQYGTSQAPAVARVRRAAGGDYQIRVQSPSGATLPPEYSVQYVVAEAGVYTLAEHGVKLEARTLASTRTDGKNAGWVGQAVSYANSYTDPVVLGQVMSENDARWSVFWARGASRGAPPDAGILYVGKHVGEDPDTARSAETLGFIVLESGTGVADGQAFSAGVSAQIVRGTGSSAAPFGVPHGLTSASGAVASMAGMAGGDGGWPVLYGSEPFSADALGLAVDEDLISDSETFHAAEAVGFLAFP
ncbi:MAG: DUF1566 domain-containing protein [Thiohalocapsa sp.]|nr:DUF1566 domain-containing protein [Thiohalocapsa sp.]